MQSHLYLSVLWRRNLGAVQESTAHLLELVGRIFFVGSGAAVGSIGVCLRGSRVGQCFYCHSKLTCSVTAVAKVHVVLAGVG